MCASLSSPIFTFNRHEMPLLLTVEGILEQKMVKKGKVLANETGVERDLRAITKCSGASTH